LRKELILDNPKTVAIYARVSSEQQAEAKTINSQISALKQRVAEDGWSLESEFCFIDDGYSGATLIRPALERLRDTIASGAIDIVYVHSPDRLARKYAYQVLLVDEFHRSGIQLVFLTNELGRNAEQDLLLQVQGMVAEYERAKMLERSRRGKRHAANQGCLSVLSGAPYGYRYITKDQGGGAAAYQIIDHQANVVRQVFEWVGIERISISEACRRLNQQGVLTRTKKTRWDRATVWGLLKNPAYKGTAAFGKTKAGPWRPPLRPQRGAPQQPKHVCSTSEVPPEQWIYIPVPPIVNESLFEMVGKQLAENRKRQRQRKRGAKYLLQGLLVCQQCGYALYGKPVSRKSAKGKRRDYAYYRCIGTDAYRFGGKRVCDIKQLRTDLLNQAVWEDVTDLLNHPQRLEQEYTRRLSEVATAEGWQSTKQLQSLTQKVKRSIGRLVDAYTEGLIQKEEFEPRIRQARVRLAQLEHQTQVQLEQEAQATELKHLINGLQEFASRVQNGLEEADFPLRRQIIRTLVKQIEVGHEKVNIVYRITPSDSMNQKDSEGLQHCKRRYYTPLRNTFITDS
jgi:site-specific DNA recombinase